jgi:hypothetical protein
MKLIIVLLIVIIIFFFIQKFKNENFESNININILSDYEIKEFIIKDKDGFLNSLTKYDLKARNSNSKKDYINKIIQSLDKKNNKLLGTTLEYKKELLIKSIKEADKLLEKNYKDIKNIKWNIILMEGDEYENGYPHTRGKYIILNKKYIDDNDIDKLIRVLIHEKIHVFQRNNPTHKIIRDYMKKKGYKKYKLREELLREKPLLRTNPDLDEWIYQDMINNKIMYCLYNNENPNSITDIQYNQNEDKHKEEHPYETMAYEISSLLI